MFRFLQKYSVPLVLTVVILLILGVGFWKPGVPLLLDYVVTPHGKVDFFQHGWSAVPQILVPILGVEGASKGTFLLILILAAYLGTLFAGKLAEQYSLPHTPILKILGAIFLLVNPFAYERMMVQPTIYAGVILLGYTIYALLFLEHRKKWILAGVSSGIALNIFLHASYMIALIFVLYTILFVRTRKGMLDMFFAGVIIAIINLNWMLAPFFDVKNSVNSISSFNLANLEAFKTATLAPMNVWFTNIFLYGFWGERYGNHYANVGFLSSLWYVAGFFLLGVMAIGKWRLWSEKGKVKSEKFSEIDNSPFIIRHSHCLVWFLGLIAVFSLVFGIGIASPLTRSLTEWMIDFIPMWQGYREPQKWIGMLMFVEAILLLVGIGFLFKKFAKDTLILSSITVSVLIVLYVWSPGALFGYHGQLRTTVYPHAFESLRTELLHDSFSGKILILPWHSYIGCKWMGRPTVSNPIQGLIAPLPFVIADNIEVSSTLYSNSSNPTTHAIEESIRLGFPHFLDSTDITHVLLAKQCYDSQSYPWIESSGRCTKTHDNDILSFYSCK